MHLLALQQLRTSHAWQRREIEGSGGSLAQKPIGTPKPAAQAAPARHSPIGLIAIGVIVLIAIAVLFFRTTDTRWPRGSDSNPAWPPLNLSAGQREGDRTEVCEIVLSSDGRQYKYSPKDATEFPQFTIGSRWTLRVNTLGGVTGVTSVK